jgi:anti-sigma28 factor (negative regulator of flagellin synthesis)
MTVKKTGHESDQISKETSPKSAKSDAGHFGRFTDFFDSDQITDTGHEIAQECSLDAAKIVEVHRRIESREYTVNTRRVADKLFELESRLRILDGPGSND